MANKDSEGHLRSGSEQAQAVEPASGNHRAHSNDVSMSRAQSAYKPASASQSSINSASTPAPRKSSSTSQAPLVSSPLAQSPRTSRNTSPLRKDKPPTLAGNLASQPSAAAIQRALSASSIPQLQNQGSSGAEATSKLPRHQQKAGTASGETTPQWPISPRLKSPPPSGPNSRRGSVVTPKKPDSNVVPSMQVPSAVPQESQSNRQASADGHRTDPQLQPPPPSKASSRGPSGKSTLETVQENTSDVQGPSPAAIQAAKDLKPLTKLPDGDQSLQQDTKTDEQKQPAESGSESAGNKSDSTSRGRRPSHAQDAAPNQSQRSRNISSKNTYTISAGKTRQGDGKQNMTVETETVASIPQSGLAPASESANRLRAENSGTVKLRPSNETIRPKKERKKAERKTRSVNQGTATSKADLFEARVASAVDEANTSDSDETFVYESNPPEPQRRQRHHSRTPSVTSSHSVAEQQRFRSMVDPFDERRIGGKRSMKFSSNPYNDVDSPESKNGTVRSHTPRHIGRFGRGGHHSASLEHQDSPYTQATKVRQQQRSRPPSPNSPQNLQFRSAGFFASNKKHNPPYDFDTEQNADDERTPLVGTVRAHRGARGVRRIASYTPDGYLEQQFSRKHCWNSRAGSLCLSATAVILIILAAFLFVFASNRTLENVKIRKIQNVLASEQELIFDLLLSAVNPNPWEIAIDDLNVDVLAKSKHLSLASQTAPDEDTRWRRWPESSLDSVDNNPNPSQDLSGHWHAPGTEDAFADVEKDAQTMLLGRIFHFDQGILFPASPVKRRVHSAAGQIRLMKPGNKTETGGSAMWKEVIQNPFELIVRGTVKYHLPISARQESVAVSSAITVHPEDGIDKQGNMRVEPIDHSEHWQWIDWPEILGDNDPERPYPPEKNDQQTPP